MRRVVGLVDPKRESFVRPPLFYVWASVSQTADSTWPVVQYNSIVSDTHGWFHAASHSYRPKLAGWYHLEWSVNVASTAVFRMHVALYVSGSLTDYGVCQDTCTSGNTQGRASRLVLLNGTTDTVEVRVYCGSATSTAAASSLTFFQGVYVSPP